MKIPLRHVFATLLLCLGAASAARSQSTNERVSITVTATNTAATGSTFALNSDTRTFTNAHSATTLLTNLTSPAATLTNLLQGIALAPFSASLYSMAWLTSTQAVLTGEPGQVMSASLTGDWGYLTSSTQYVGSLLVARVPIAGLPVNARTNLASGLAEALALATNAIPPSVSALANYVSLTNAQSLTHKILVSPTFSNAVNYGSAFSSPTDGVTGSERFGAGATATSPYAVAVGAGAGASGTNSATLGYASVASGRYSAALGSYASASGLYSTALGGGAEASGERAIAVGQNTSASYNDSMAIGVGVSSTRTNEIRIGGSQEVVVGGLLHATKGVTNLSSLGISTNSGALHLAAELRLPGRSQSSLVNGNNAGINLGTNTVILLSGATTICQLAGFAAGADGDTRLIRLSGAVTNILVNESGSAYSTDPTPANRIRTGTGGDIVLTNQPAWLSLRYDSSASRWDLLNASR